MVGSLWMCVASAKKSTYCLTPAINKEISIPTSWSHFSLYYESRLCVCVWWALLVFRAPSLGKQDGVVLFFARCRPSPFQMQTRFCFYSIRSQCLFVCVWKVRYGSRSRAQQHTVNSMLWWYSSRVLLVLAWYDSKVCVCVCDSSNFNYAMLSELIRSEDAVNDAVSKKCHFHHNISWTMRDLALLYIKFTHRKSAVFRQQRHMAAAIEQKQRQTKYFIFLSTHHFAVHVSRFF